MYRSNKRLVGPSIERCDEQPEFHAQATENAAGDRCVER
jgi:hypothetical protein